MPTLMHIKEILSSSNCPRSHISETMCCTLALVSLNNVSAQVSCDRVRSSWTCATRSRGLPAKTAEAAPP